MIITKLQGGLGNQMFQYAVGRFLVEKNKTTLKLDLSFYNKKQNGLQRNYSLNCFNIIKNIAKDDEINKLKKYKWEKGIKNFIHNLFFANKAIYIKEEQFNFNEKSINTSSNIYLDGYWQNEKYFKDIKNILYDEFTLNNESQVKNTKLEEEIKNSNSVSLHIRRTDYLIKSHKYEICNLEYYKKAIDKIALTNKNIKIFIFSDDISWSKNNLKTNFPTTFISNNKDYEDLILMSLCKHNIIANSSFSWWGAWLNKNPNKIIITPKKWLNNSTKNTKGLIPKSWIKM
ncbi:MAG: alpha-1,2-fucosyltransferase [Candidatus Pacebacteria bacterium]|nr:alpha-1,2-fucosyltransferase [Candidatus Paceibacterota bacterium]